MLVGNTIFYVDLSLFQMIEGLRCAFPRALSNQEPKHRRLVGLHDRVAVRHLPFKQEGIFRHYPELDDRS